MTFICCACLRDKCALLQLDCLEDVSSCMRRIQCCQHTWVYDSFIRII